MKYLQFINLSKMGTLGFFLFYFSLPAEAGLKGFYKQLFGLPKIIEVSTSEDYTEYPLVGPESGGTVLYLYGKRFQQGATVSLGRLVCNTERVTSTELICRIPAAEPGIYRISVTNPNGKTAQANVNFRYVAKPKLIGVSLTAMPPSQALEHFSQGSGVIQPVLGSIHGETELFIYGKHFVDSPRVTIGTTDCPNVQYYCSPTCMKTYQGHSHLTSGSLTRSSPGWTVSPDRCFRSKTRRTAKFLKLLKNSDKLCFSKTER